MCLNDSPVSLAGLAEPSTHALHTLLQAMQYAAPSQQPAVGHHHASFQQGTSAAGIRLGIQSSRSGGHTRALRGECYLRQSPSQPILVLH